MILSLLFLQLYLWIAQVDYIYGIPQIIKYVLSVLILGVIIFYRFANPSKPTRNALDYSIIIFFLTWSIILLAYASISVNSIFEIQIFLANPYFFIPYFLPVFLLYTKYDLDFFKNYLHYSSLLIFPAVLFQFYVALSGLTTGFAENKLSEVMIFDIGSSFVLLTAHFSRKKYIFNIALLYMMLMIFFAAQYGKRGMLLEYLLIWLVMIIMRLRTPLLNLHDRMKMYIAGLLLLLMVILFGQFATSSYVFQRGFDKEAFEASRGVVFEAFFLDFGSTPDWIFGRGIKGTVLRSVLTGNVAEYIENGLLTLLLKGGLLYLIPFLMIVFRAIYLGLRNSNNDLVKAMAYLLIIYLIIMFPFNVPCFSAKYIFMWISVNACFQPELRNAGNDEIYRMINS